MLKGCIKWEHSLRVHPKPASNPKAVHIILNWRPQSQNLLRESTFSGCISFQIKSFLMFPLKASVSSSHNFHFFSNSCSKCLAQCDQTLQKHFDLIILHLAKLNLTLIKNLQNFDYIWPHFPKFDQFWQYLKPQPPDHKSGAQSAKVQQSHYKLSLVMILCKVIRKFSPLHKFGQIRLVSQNNVWQVWAR